MQIVQWLFILLLILTKDQDQPFIVIFDRISHKQVLGLIKMLFCLLLLTILFKSLGRLWMKAIMIWLIPQQIGDVFNPLINYTNNTYQLFAQQMGRITDFFGTPPPPNHTIPLEISNSTHLLG